MTLESLWRRLSSFQIHAEMTTAVIIAWVSSMLHAEFTTPHFSFLITYANFHYYLTSRWNDYPYADMTHSSFCINIIGFTHKRLPLRWNDYPYFLHPCRLITLKRLPLRWKNYLYFLHQCRTITPKRLPSRRNDYPHAETNTLMQKRLPILSLLTHHFVSIS